MTNNKNIATISQINKLKFLDSRYKITVEILKRFYEIYNNTGEIEFNQVLELLYREGITKQIISKKINQICKAEEHGLLKERYGYILMNYFTEIELLTILRNNNVFVPKPRRTQTRVGRKLQLASLIVSNNIKVEK